MEFPFDINPLFPERVSILDHTLFAGGKSAVRPDLQDNIANVLDELGRASAMSQQLTAPITSVSKLQTQKHQLYLMKDGESNGGRGAVVGFLKVGLKKLFLLDKQGVHVEAEPLCILDFYIAENLQRHGYGLQLFDFMLQHKNVEPALMAYDRPSPKFLSFLAKHYNLMQSIPQVNNFVVFEGFFLNRSAAQLRKAPLRKPDGEIKPYSLMEREVVRQEQRVPPWPFAPPHSPQRSVSSPYSQSPISSPSRVPRVGTGANYSPQSPLLDHCRRRTNQQGLVARSSLYSRHLDQRCVGLLDRPLPVLRTPWAQTLGSTGTRRAGSILTTWNRSFLPALPAPKNSIHSQSSVSSTCTDINAANSEEDFQTSESPAGGTEIHQRPVCVNGGGQRQGEQRGWSWTVGEPCYTAQWVKRKHQYRSTRPW